MGIVSASRYLDYSRKHGTNSIRCRHQSNVRCSNQPMEQLLLDWKQPRKIAVNEAALRSTHLNLRAHFVRRRRHGDRPAEEGCTTWAPSAGGPVAKRAIRLTFFLIVSAKEFLLGVEDDTPATCVDNRRARN